MIVFMALLLGGIAGSSVFLITRGDMIGLVQLFVVVLAGWAWAMVETERRRGMPARDVVRGDDAG